MTGEIRNNAGIGRKDGKEKLQGLLWPVVMGVCPKTYFRTESE